MASITFLGTGPGSGMAGRFQSSILLQSTDSRVLVDAGDPCTTQLFNHGLTPSDLDAVWITHAHSDHTSGLPMLLQSAWVTKRGRPLPLGLPRHLVEPLAHWLRAVLIPPEILGFPLETFAWESGVARTQDGISVTPHPTTHLERSKERLNDASLESFLFDVTVENRRVIFSGDIGSTADLLPHLQSPVDLLICEMAHVSPEEIIAALAPFQIGTICFNHLSNAADERRGQLKLLCAEKLPLAQEVYFPNDGERIDF